MLSGFKSSGGIGQISLDMCDIERCVTFYFFGVTRQDMFSNRNKYMCVCVTIRGGKVYPFMCLDSAD